MDFLDTLSTKAKNALVGTGNFFSGVGSGFGNSFVKDDTPSPDNIDLEGLSAEERLLALNEGANRQGTTQSRAFGEEIGDVGADLIQGTLRSLDFIGTKALDAIYSPFDMGPSQLREKKLENPDELSQNLEQFLFGRELHEKAETLPEVGEFEFGIDAEERPFLAGALGTIAVGLDSFPGGKPFKTGIKTLTDDLLESLSKSDNVADNFNILRKELDETISDDVLKVLASDVSKLTNPKAIDDIVTTTQRQVGAEELLRGLDPEVDPKVIRETASELATKTTQREIDEVINGYKAKIGKTTQEVVPKATKEALDSKAIETRLISKETELELLEETIRQNPATALEKFARRHGELPQVTGKSGKSIFEQKGDDIVTELGFDSVDEAIEAMDVLKTQRAKVVALRQEVKSDKALLRSQPKSEALQAQKSIATPSTSKVQTETSELVAKKHGNTERIVSQLEKKGLTKAEADDIVLENGVRLGDTVKVKREKNGVLSAVVTKKDLEDIETNFDLKNLTSERWVNPRSPKELARKTTNQVLDWYEIPQVFFRRSGLYDHFYRPIREAERNATKQVTEVYDQFKEAGLLKEKGWFTPDRFTLTKKESEDIGKYFLDRQGKNTGVKLDDLTEDGKKFVEIFDAHIAKHEDRFFEVARLNGKDPRKVENYAPIMTREDIELAQDMGDMDYIFRKHPAFGSLKERVDDVPLEMYELDYRKVATQWINSQANFNHLGEVGPQVKYLANSDEFRDIVGNETFDTVNRWLKFQFNPERPKVWEKGVRFMRQKNAIASLGLNIGSVIKQSLSQIPLSIIEKAPPKLHSKYAKDFGINVADLPSIKERRGSISIADMQGKLDQLFVGPLSQFDKKNAQLSLNGLLDSEYKKALKENNFKPISDDTAKDIARVAQDKLDMWYGGMTRSQIPGAWRSELGKTMNMFIGPLTSQLNGFVYTIAKAKGMEKPQKIAEVATAVITIAYMEQVITNLSPNWSDQKEMTHDVLRSMAGNVPQIGNIVWAFESGDNVALSPIISNFSRILRQMGKEDNMEGTLTAIAEFFGQPKQLRRTWEGYQLYEEGGLRDKNDKLLAPVDGFDRYRSFIRGKYGSLATQDYVRNIGVKSADRSWHIPEVEFLQNGDYDRKAELYRAMDSETQETLYNELSEGQRKKLDKALAQPISSGQPPGNQEAILSEWVEVMQQKVRDGKIDPDEAVKQTEEFRASLLGNN